MNVLQAMSLVTYEVVQFVQYDKHRVKEYLDIVAKLAVKEKVDPIQLLEEMLR